MTLVLTGVFPGFVVQASDRLVSLMPNLRPGDTLANKSIVFRATDGIVTLAFAGNAYVGDIPLDEWIAGILHGQPIKRWEGEKRPALSQHGGHHGMRISAALYKLKRALEDPAFPISHHVKIQGAGFRAWRKRTYPLSFVIVKRGGTKTVETGFSPRNAMWQGVHLGSIGVTVDRAELWQRLISMAQVRGDQKSLADIEQVFVQYIRDTAERVQGVGKNVLTVTLDMNAGRSRFHPYEDHPLAIHMSDHQQQIAECTHTPWVLSPGLVRAPSIEIGAGAWQLALGGYGFEIGGGQSVSGPMQIMMSSSLPRPTVKELGRPRTLQMLFNRFRKPSD